jgi:acetylornithine/succinyldiaminopimelate/putrescine aminotransferase
MHFAPGVPGISHIGFNKLSDLSNITERTACVILEAVQAESGVVLPEPGYLKAVEQRCRETGALMILDEIQTGNGRTGSLFAHIKYGITPDVLLLAKSMGGGMPIGAVIANKELLNVFTKSPSLGHLTTFGGHPVSCAAAHASLQTLLDLPIIQEVEGKANLFKKLLEHKIVKEVRSSGLMMAVELKRKKYLKHVIQYCFDHKVLVDYFLFNQKSFRLAPPLIISETQIKEVCMIFQQSFDFAFERYNK